ncbi:hypothetical protein ALP96_103015 [Pseudomonas savastanoi pv. glycinea]|nr:Uncharacterized protein AC513_4129 [Pseudomonas savastanoi pv. phaseolicola]KPB51888.1 Uncharacterized protein AC512_1396 [Pseudomonas savastanoi pv. phaseolicola]RMQ96503.1 hypothetical protein ALP96_103015 [Pseudomonas savastanoi pv. glycinea]
MAPSFQTKPSFSTCAFRTSTAAFSPPDVHQCTTSTVPLDSAAVALRGNNEAREMTTARRDMEFIELTFLVVMHEQV